MNTLIDLYKLAAVGVVFDPTRYNIDQTAIQNYLNKLLSVAPGDSGADSIAIAPINELGDVGTNTVYEMIVALKSYIDTHKASGDHDSRYYTEVEITNLLNGFYLKAETYSQSEVDSLLNLVYPKTQVYTQEEVNNLLAAVVLGQIGDGSLSDSKLSNATGQIKDTVTTLNGTVTTHLADYVRNPAYGPATGAVNAYTFSAMVATALVDGMSVYIDNVIAANTGASTFNWSGLGAKAIVDSKGNALTAGKMPLNCIIGLRYNASASNFQLLGEGSDVLTGDFVADDLLSGKTGYSNNPLTKITGTRLPGNVIAGDILIMTYIDTNTASTTWIKKKEIKMTCISGVIRVKFSLSSALASYVVNAQIYKNGVAVGTLRTSSVTSDTAYVEDISFVTNDLIQIYLKTSNAGVLAYVKQISLCIGAPTTQTNLSLGNE